MTVAASKASLATLMTCSTLGHNWGTTLVVTSVLLSWSQGLQITEVKFPSVVLSGDSVHLECHYRLEGDSLYSLTWWKDDKQFYKYVPALMPPKTTFDVPGIVVDMLASGLQDVMLTSVDHRASGTVRCEVVSEVSFEKDSRGGNFTVVDHPSRAPRITGRTGGRSVGELLLLNCTAPPSHPPATLTWLINGRQASTETVIKYPGRNDGEGRVGSSSGLQMFLRSHHFIKGVLAIGCSASVLQLKEQLSEVVVIDSDYPVEAPKSQFSEGRSNALTLNGAEHSVLLLLLLLLMLLWKVGR